MVAHCSQLKLCCIPPPTVSLQPRLEFQGPTTSYADATENGHSGIGGYTSATDQSMSEPPTHSQKIYNKMNYICRSK